MRRPVLPRKPKRRKKPRRKKKGKHETDSSDDSDDNKATEKAAQKLRENERKRRLAQAEADSVITDRMIAQAEARNQAKKDKLNLCWPIFSRTFQKVWIRGPQWPLDKAAGMGVTIIFLKRIDCKFDLKQCTWLKQCTKDWFETMHKMLSIAMSKHKKKWRHFSGRPDYNLEEALVRENVAVTTNTALQTSKLSSETGLIVHR